MPLLSSPPASDNRTPTPPRRPTCREQATAAAAGSDSSDNYALQRAIHRIAGGWPHTHARTSPPADGRPREGRTTSTCRYPAAAPHEDSRPHARAPGTSSPPHDVQRAPARPPCRTAPGRSPPPPAGDGTARLVGLGRLERPTSRLSGVRSNQLSYRPKVRSRNRTARGRNRPRTSGTGRRLLVKGRADGGGPRPGRPVKTVARDPVSGRGHARDGRSPRQTVAGQHVPPPPVRRDAFRKEVIQPQVPLRLPCYDFTPVADPTVDACLPCGLARRLKVEPTPMV